MHTLRDHERLAVEMLLAGDHEVLAKLRDQAADATATKRTYSTAGEYVDLTVPAQAELISPADLILQDIELVFEGVKDGTAIL